MMGDGFMGAEAVTLLTLNPFLTEAVPRFTQQGKMVNPEEGKGGIVIRVIIKTRY